MHSSSPRLAKKVLLPIAVLAILAWLSSSNRAAGAGFGRGVDPVLYSKFQAAQQAFDTAVSTDDFLKAAALYQEILDAGLVSGVVLYNQGNAFMRGGHRGRAVACYLQARRYRPRDPYLDANLRYAMGAAETATKRKPVVEHLLFWLDWVSYPGKFSLTTQGALATLVLAAVGLWWRHRWLNYLASGLLAVTLALAASAGYDWYRFGYLQHGVVISAEAVARKGNAASYEPAFTKPLVEATEFQVIDRRGDWILIRLAGSREGWIPERDAVVF